MAASLDIKIRRNEDWVRSLTIADDAGQPIDVSNWSVALEIKPPLSDNVIDDAVITDGDVSNGEIEIKITASPGSPLAGYGNPLHAAKLCYDLIATDDVGDRIALIAGNIFLERGITQ